MKKTIITTMLALVALTGWAQSQQIGEKNYTISGDLTVLTSKTAISIKADTVYILNDSTRIIPPGQQQKKYAVKDGKFEISGSVSRPIYSNLMIQFEVDDHGKKRRTMHGIPFILEPGNIVLGGSDFVLFNGTPLNDASIAIFNRLSELARTGDADKLKQEATSFVKQHTADPASIFVVMQASSFLKGKDVLAMLDMCSEDMQNTITDLSLIKDRLVKEANSPQVGDKFKDFAVEYEGKTTRFSDYVGRDKYVLVDFWASWCAPCRREIPNLIAAYNKYKDKGLQVLGVASWDKPDDTKKAIQEEQIPYPQIINAQQIGTDVYGISGIPEIILIAPDGTVLARGLRGENIEKKLAEIFGNTGK